MASSLLPPPGLPVTHITRLIVDGGDHAADWDSFELVKRYTNAFVINEDGSEILLGFKKRGFGVNMYNGFGGKVEAGETSMQAARRELKEEAGIDAPLEHCGILLFKSTGFPYAHHIDMYRAASWSGEITESDEMRPEWFSTKIDQNCTTPTPVNGIPYEKMWEDDRMWLPLLLAKTKFIGRADFGVSPSGSLTSADGPMNKWWFAEVSALDEAEA